MNVVMMIRGGKRDRNYCYASPLTARDYMFSLYFDKVLRTK